MQVQKPILKMLDAMISSLDPFSLQVFKKETNEKEKKIQKIDLKRQLQAPGFKLSKNDPQFLNSL